MSTRVRQAFQSAAGAAGGEVLNVEDVFSTYLYEGNATARSITNGIDLSTEGGLVWSKSRSSGVGVGDNYHYLFDTERGSNKYIFGNVNNAEVTSSLLLTSFNTDGYSIGTRNANNQTGEDYASWTFRKAPKFFDVVTYTGDGTSGRSISHNLGCDVGMIIIKNLSRSSDWHTWHRGFTSTSYGAALNQTYAEFTNGGILTATPTSTTVTIKNPGYDGAGTNNSGDSYVMYLFAHNDGDGNFGPTGDQDIIKCGSYTGNGSTDGTEVNLGFEPQWVLIKNSSGSYNWQIYDNMRGVTTGGNDEYLLPNSSGAEAGFEALEFNATGFKLKATGAVINGSGSNYIYIAIRRGPMAVPESATDVFAVDTWGGTVTAPPAFYSGWPVDGALNRSYATTANNSMIARMTDNKAYFTNTTSNGTFGSAGTLWDLQDGLWDQTGTVSTYISYMWRRAPNYFDVVAYTGNGTAGRTVSHNLGVAPEMMWVKRRDSADNWLVYHSGLDVDGDGRPETDALVLDTNGAAFDYNRWNDTAPTATEFTVHSDSIVNANGGNYIAFLFASLNGISKVGSYTGNGNASGQNIDCGFSSGARFVLIKTSSVNGSWNVWDSTRGIVAGDDPYLLLNETDAQYENDDYIDPYSAGFNAVNNSNVSGREYIFYAIA